MTPSLDTKNVEYMLEGFGVLIYVGGVCDTCQRRLGWGIWCAICQRGVGHMSEGGSIRCHKGGLTYVIGGSGIPKIAITMKNHCALMSEGGADICQRGPAIPKKFNAMKIHFVRMSGGSAICHRVAEAHKI